MNNATTPQAAPERWVALAKDVFALLRDLVLVLLFLGHVDKGQPQRN